MSPYWVFAYPYSSKPILPTTSKENPKCVSYVFLTCSTKYHGPSFASKRTTSWTLRPTTRGPRLASRRHGCLPLTNTKKKWTHEYHRLSRWYPRVGTADCGTLVALVRLGRWWWYYKLWNGRVGTVDCGTAGLRDWLGERVFRESASPGGARALAKRVVVGVAPDADEFAVVLDDADAAHLPRRAQLLRSVGKGAVHPHSDSICTFGRTRSGKTPRMNAHARLLQTSR